MPETLPDRLAQAGAAAEKQDSKRPATSPVASCPAKDPAWVEIELIDAEDDTPIADEPFVLTLPDGREIRGKTDAKGLGRAAQFERGGGVCTFGFTAMDAAIWLPGALADAPNGSSLKIDESECVAKIAARSGLLPQTIWDHPENEELKTQRRTPYALLAQDDTVFVPDLRRLTDQIPVDSRTPYRRLRGSEVLRLCFLDAEGAPRRDLPYLLEFEAEARNGNLTGEGALEELVPPALTEAKLTLKEEIDGDVHEEVYQLMLSHLDPADKLSGAQQRLRNLGFDCADEFGSAGPETEAALLAFQNAQGMAETGAPDARTLSCIESEYGG